MFAGAAPADTYLPHELAMQVRAIHSWSVPRPQATTNPDQPTVVLAAADSAVFQTANPVAA